MKTPKLVAGSTTVILDDRRPNPESTTMINDYSSKQRMADATLKVYVNNNKKAYQLMLMGISLSTKNSLYNLWGLHNTIEFYEDQDDAESKGTFYWMNNFDFREALYTGGELGLYTGTIVLEEA